MRDHLLALIGESVGNYDLEILELDFLRHVVHFPRSGELREQQEMITSFIHEIRDLIRKSGKRVELLPRVPNSPASVRSEYDGVLVVRNVELEIL